MSDNLMLDEFKLEAFEMIDEAEEALINIEKGDDFNASYLIIFRALHSLKGASGMFGLLDLQKHVHSLENFFETLKDKEGASYEQVDYFLKGLDAVKDFLSHGGKLEFETIELDEFIKIGIKEDRKQSELKGSPKSSDFAEDTDVDDGAKVHHKDKKKFTKLNGLVYIVDDEIEILNLLKDNLEQHELVVKVFDSPLKALEDLKKVDELPDLIISDIKMPEMSGLTFTKEVTDLHPSLPVIFISGYITKDILFEALDLGVHFFLEKPFKEEELIQVLFGAIEKNRIIKLLNKSINLILYQFSDLEDFLVENGKTSIRDSIKEEINNLLSSKNKVRDIIKS